MSKDDVRTMSGYVHAHSPPPFFTDQVIDASGPRSTLYEHILMCLYNNVRTCSHQLCVMGACVIAKTSPHDVWNAEFIRPYNMPT